MSEKTNPLRKLERDRAEVYKAAYDQMEAKDDVGGDVCIFAVQRYSNYVLPTNYKIYRNYYDPNAYYAIVRRWRQDTDFNKTRNPTAMRNRQR